MPLRHLTHRVAAIARAPGTRRRSSTGLVAALAMALGACAGAPPTAPMAVRADRVIDDAVAGDGLSGAFVLMRDGRVVYERAVGLAQRDPDRAFAVDTPSDGGSMAKTLTAAALWELAADGRVSLDDAVTRHLPEYPYAGQTLRDLLTYRSGLPDYGLFEPELRAHDELHTPDLLRLTAQRQPQPRRPPGVRVEYANLGYDAAALVVERVTGQPIARWWQQRYFTPLGLDGMFARPARFADFPVPRTVGYRRDADGRWQPFDAFDGEGFIGGSNVHASARDWARWGDAFARGRVMPPERLQRGLREAMFVSGLPEALTMLSWYCDATRRRCHYSGQYNAFFAHVWWDRERREVVAWVGNNLLPPWRCEQITRDLVDVLAGRDPLPDRTPAPLALPRAQRAALAGDYRSPTLGALQWTVHDGGATLRVGEGEAASAFAVDRGTYYLPTLGLWLRFSGTPEAPTLHLRSMFLTAEASREATPRR